MKWSKQKNDFKKENEEENICDAIFFKWNELSK